MQLRNPFGHDPFEGSAKRWEHTVPDAIFEFDRLHVQQEDGKGVEDESCRRALLPDFQRHGREVDGVFRRREFFQSQEGLRFALQVLK